MSGQLSDRCAFEVIGAAGPGFLHQLTGVIARHGGDITSVQIMETRPLSATKRWRVVEILEKAK